MGSSRSRQQATIRQGFHQSPLAHGAKKVYADYEFADAAGVASVENTKHENSSLQEDALLCRPPVIDQIGADLGSYACTSWSFGIPDTFEYAASTSSSSGPVPSCTPSSSAEILLACAMACSTASTLQGRAQRVAALRISRLPATAGAGGTAASNLPELPRFSI
jgi:hypothetical protein